MGTKHLLALDVAHAGQVEGWGRVQLPRDVAFDPAVAGRVVFQQAVQGAAGHAARESPAQDAFRSGQAQDALGFRVLHRDVPDGKGRRVRREVEGRLRAFVDGQSAGKGGCAAPHPFHAALGNRQGRPGHEGCGQGEGLVQSQHERPVHIARHFDHGPFDPLPSVAQFPGNLQRGVLPIEPGAGKGNGGGPGRIGRAKRALAEADRFVPGSRFHGQVVDAAPGLPIPQCRREQGAGQAHVVDRDPAVQTPQVFLEEAVGMESGEQAEQFSGIHLRRPGEDLDGGDLPPAHGRGNTGEVGLSQSAPGLVCRKAGVGAGQPFAVDGDGQLQPAVGRREPVPGGVCLGLDDAVTAFEAQPPLGGPLYVVQALDRRGQRFAGHQAGQDRRQLGQVRGHVDVHLEENALVQDENQAAFLAKGVSHAGIQVLTM